MTAHPIDTKALRRLADGASAGHWEAHGQYVSADEGRDGIAQFSTDRDAEFIAAARQAIPELLDALEQAEADRDWNIRSSRNAKKERIKANARADHAEARIKAVRDVHTGTVWPGVADKPICDACDQLWPCDTIRALEG